MNRAETRTPATGGDLSVVARGGILNLAGAGVQGVLAFAIVLAIARGLGPARAGVFLQASSLFLILSHICELGADTGLVRMIPRYQVLSRHRDLRRLLLIGLVPGTALAAAVGAGLFAVAPAVAGVLTQARYEAAFTHDLRTLAPFLPASVGLTLLLSATRGFGRMTPSVVVDKFGRSGLQLAVVAVAAFGGLGTGWLALAWVAPFLLAAAPAVVWLRLLLRQAEHRHSATSEPAHPQGQVAGEFWRFSLPRALAASMKVGVDKLDIVLVGALASARAAGIYAASTRLLIAGTMASVAVSQALGPMISRHFAAEARDEARSVYQSATAWVTLVTWPIYLNLIVFAPVILRIFGPQYAEASTAVVVVALALLVAHGLGPIDLVLLMAGKSLWSTGNMAVGLAANVGLNLLLVPHFGITGAGIAWATSLLLMNVLALGQVWRAIRLHPFGPATVLAAAAGAVCFGAVPALVRIAAGPSFTAWVTAGLLSVALYGPFCWHRRDDLHLTTLAAAIRRRQPDPNRRALRSPTTPLDQDDGLRPAITGG